MRKILILLFLLLWGESVYCQIIAGFTANDTVGCNTLIVQFENTSSGNETLSYQWDFGNGTFSSLKDPQVVYNEAGSYTISLIAYNQSFSDTLIKVNYIVLFKAPKITALHASPTVGCVPLETTLTGDIEMGEAPINEIVWDFGDGNSSSLMQPTIQYNAAGKYSISLFVTDTNNCESNFSAKQFVVAIASPIINFSAENTISCLDTFTVSFKNLSTASSPLSYYWDFGNGFTSTLANPKQLYNEFKDYSVKLIGTDAAGCIDSLTKPSYIQMQDLQASVLMPDRYLCKHENLAITNTTIGANKHNWLFGDNTTSTLMTPQKNYKDTGDFNIIYIASLNADCFDTLTFKVKVDPVTAKFESDKSYGCEFPLSVQYSDNSIDASSWHWLFGDKSQSNLKNPQVEYSVSPDLALEHNLFLSDTLIVESEMQCKDTMVIDSSIHLYLPQVYFTPNDSSKYQTLLKGCVPIQTNFQNESQSFSTNDPFVTFQWDFGDNTSSQQNNPIHNYKSEGEYKVTLSVTNQSGCVNTYTSKVLAGTPQTAKFSYSGKPVICGSESIEITNESTDSMLINGWIWEFSDGTNSTVPKPLIYFSDTGYISGALTVFYNGCKGSTAILDSFIYVNGPTGDFKISLNCDEPFKYYFNSSVKGAETWYYGFGDNSFDSSQTAEVLHEYANRMNYKTYLQATNTGTGCNLLIEKKVLVRELKADYEFLTLENCPGDTIFVNPENTIDNEYFVFENRLVRYLWDFGDETEKVYGFGTSNHVFKESGIYNVSLFVKDVNGCEQELIKPIKIYGIDAAFSVSDSVGCAPFTSDFFDTSKADTLINSWNWDFGNSHTDTLQHPTQTFIDDSSHTITLIVTDIIGCKDTVIRKNALYSSNPIAEFKALKTNNCFNDSVVFQNISTGRIKSVQWDFGNSVSSLEFSPKIPYTDTGFFDVSLQVLDSLGCINEITKESYIFVQANPVADFTNNSNFSTCYPKGIGFTDVSVSPDILLRHWDFGDNSVLEDNIAPYHTYQKSGVFDVKLKVLTQIGCVDSIVKNDLIEIGGPYAEIIAPDTSCINIPISIAFSESNNINSYQWTLEDGSIFNTNPFVKTYTNFGGKKVYLNLQSDTLGTCDKLIADSIQIPVLIADFTIDDSAQCLPFSSFTHNTSTNASRFEWHVNNNITAITPNAEIIVDVSGISEIKFVAINSAACRDSITKKITVHPLPKIQLNNDTLICQFDSIVLNVAGGNQYYWYNNTEPIDSLVSSIIVQPLTNNQYNVKVIDANACVNFDSVYIEVQQMPGAFIFNNDTTLIIGESVELKGRYTNGDILEWHPSEYLSCSNCETTLAMPLETTKFIFTVSDNNNCFVISDSVNIQIDAKYSVDVPSSFSPNGDGINDLLLVKGWGIKELMHFEIYDLTGRLVFKSNNLFEGWDGNSHLGQQPEGMYVYNVNVLSYDNVNRTKQGYVYIVK